MKRASKIFVALALVLLVVSCRVPSEPRKTARPAENATNRFEFSEPQMGLPFRIVLYAPDRALAETAARAAFRRIAQLNDILSDYDSDSELSRLSRTSGENRAVPVSDDLWFVLQRSQELAARTEGAFDITVGRYVNLWRKARRDKMLPRPDLLESARAAVGWKNLVLERRHRTAKLLAPEMRLDLGAIAKGYATDEAMNVLRAHGITRALVSGGGDMTAGAPPPGQPGWRIEIAPLDTPGAPPARFVRLHDAGLATSGDMFQHVEIDGVRYSHIVDPHTGLGLTDHSLVTVIAPDGITADSLATAVSVLGPDKGLRLVRSIPNATVHIVRKRGDSLEVRESSNFPRDITPGSP
jgi:thiamine biosynthesis lipoprotein